MAALATFFPWELGAKADPFAPAPAGIRPEWYFLWAFESLKHVPPTVAGLNGELVAVAAMGAAAIAALALPLLARPSPRGRCFVVVAGAAALLFMAAMTALALRGSTP